MRKKAYHYPWRHNNTFEVLVDGNSYFSSMLAEIEKAGVCILLETYLFESGKTADLFINKLCDAKARGVDVFIILDEYGSKGLSRDDKNRLLNSGIEILLYNPASLFNFGKSLKRDHRKLLSIDKKTAFIGGAGITDQFNPETSTDYWHDVMLKVTGNVVTDLNDSFNRIWKKQKHSLLHYEKHETGQSSSSIKKSRVLVAAGAEKNEIIRAIITRIRSSKHQVWLTSPYFISSWKIRRALRHAARKGVDVRLIFPGPHSDHKWVTYGMQRYYQRLLKANIAIYEFQPRFTHAKIILCDNWYTIGSSNLDRWNQFLNLDANIEVYDPDSHKKIFKLFLHDFTRSHLIILNQWTTRSLSLKLKEWISGLAIYLLGVISQKFKR